MQEDVIPEKDNTPFIIESEKDNIPLVVESEKDNTPFPSREMGVETDTPVPSALKEICSLNLGGAMTKFVPAVNFLTNLQHIKNMKAMKLTILDYAMCKEITDPTYVFFIFCALCYFSIT